MKIGGQTVEVGYKVLKTKRWDTKYYRYREEGLYSTRGLSSVTYRHKRWIQPKKSHGPLAVFGELGYARKFAGCDCVIYKCWYVPSKQKIQWDDTGRYIEAKHMPTGKVLADAVYLIEPVK